VEFLYRWQFSSDKKFKYLGYIIEEDIMKYLISLGLCLVVVLTACQPSSSPTLSVDDMAGTAAAQTSEFGNSAGTIAAQTVLAWEIAHYTPTPTVTATPLPTVVGTVLNNVNCRSGPAPTFPLVEVVNQGDGGQLIAQNTENETWYELELPDGKQCWVLAESLELSSEPNNLPEIESPPTPAPPSSYWVGDWTLWWNPTSNPNWAYSGVVKITVSMAGNNTIKLSSWPLSGSCPYLVYLTVNQDGSYASGSRSECGPASIQLHLDPNHNQLRGNWYYMSMSDSTYFGCASKNGAPRPLPCP
jgi:hypothetical protein